MSLEILGLILNFIGSLILILVTIFGKRPHHKIKKRAIPSRKI